MNPLLNCMHITKTFGSFTALSDLSFQIYPGRIVGLLGPNGSGKSTFMKMASGLLAIDKGEITIHGYPVGTETKRIVSYLPERTYLDQWTKVSGLIDYFSDFYSDFNKKKAYEMLQCLGVSSHEPLKTMSKGTKEKVQLILVMSRDAMLYLLDEPIGGVDPASRDYILNKIITNYHEHGSVLITTHLIQDIEPILDDVLFIQKGQITLSMSVDDIHSKEGKSIDTLFREVFKC